MMTAANRSANQLGAAELDRATLMRCRAGDPIAFRRFVDRYERPVHAVLSRMLGYGSHVEDLAQEAFLRAFGSFGHFDPNGAAKPSTWILTIAVRLALDLRKHERVVRESSAKFRAQQESESPEREIARAQARRVIELAVNELSDDQRAAIVLTEFHDFSIREVAQALNLAEGTVKTRLFRAREQLRMRLSTLQEDA